MNEYDELNEMLSIESEETRTVLKDYTDDVNLILSKLKGYHVNSVDISYKYDLENDFEKFKADDIFLRYNLNSDALNHTLGLLLDYVKDLQNEIKFNEFRKEKETNMNKNEYMEYTHNNNVKTDILNDWYQQFINQK